MKAKKNTTIIGYKGLDSELKCLNFQFQIGGKYHEQGADLCHNGFHFCLNPLDIFNYYEPTNSRFCVVNANGVTSQTSRDSKRVCTDIEIVREITLQEVISAGVDYIIQNTGDGSVATNTGDGGVATNTGDWSVATNTGNKSVATNTGDESVATNTGDGSVATNTGNKSVATNTGDESVATNTGNWSVAVNTGYGGVASVSEKDGVAIATGYGCKVKGAIGCGIVAVERGNWDGTTYPLIAIKAAVVDGIKIKANTYYVLKNNKFVEATK
jgi:hypothetical protein